MKKVSLLVFKSYIGPLFVTFFISLFVLLMQFLWKWIEDFIGKGLSWDVITETLLYSACNLIPMALPLAVLLASVMTFGNMGEHYELTALKAAGISLQKTMRPLIVLIGLISIGAFFFSNNVLPYTNLKMASKLYDVTQQRPEVNIKQGVFSNDIDGYSIKVGRKVPGSSMMYDFMIYNHTSLQGNIEVTVADSGIIKITNDKKNMIATLYSGDSYSEMQDNTNGQQKPFRHDKFKKQVVVFQLSGFNKKQSDEDLFKNNYQMMNLSQLDYSVDSLSKLYNHRLESFPVVLLNATYNRYDFKSKNSGDTVLMLKDSLRNYKPYNKLTTTYNFDTVYVQLQSIAKKQALDLAIEHATRIKAEIETNAADIYERGKWIRKHELAWYQKFTLSFACLIFFFIGAPLGSIIRKGGFGLPFIVSTLLFMVYYIISVTGQKFVREDVMPVIVGAWLSSVTLFPLGVFLTYKATTDSSLFNTDSYLSGIKKFFVKLSNLRKKKKTDLDYDPINDETN